ncbi:hypothetical protein GBAR_LOCUS3011 [Geodia barretti]|uniref:Uncharacterized protein n=1 Tax=Geodia barretti TaxID=519541 RepID=A0AA35R2V1_GEOBA|nr:hypothetical protein GBAR_LOCUS3011 [Geodia barretti]
MPLCCLTMVLLSLFCKVSSQLACVCGFADLATALLDFSTTGVLPVVIEEDEDTLRRPPTKPAPPIPPRGAVQDEDQDLPPEDIPPLAPEDIPPSPPPPLAPEDIPLSVPPPPLRAELASKLMHLSI